MKLTPLTNNTNDIETLFLLDQEDNLLSSNFNLRLDKKQIESLSNGNILNIESYFIFKYKNCIHLFESNKWTFDEINELKNIKFIFKEINNRLNHFKLPLQGIDGYISQITSDFIVQEGDFSLGHPVVSSLIRKPNQKINLKISYKNILRDSITYYNKANNEIIIKLY